MFSREAILYLSSSLLNAKWKFQKRTNARCTLRKHPLQSRESWQKMETSTLAIIAIILRRRRKRRIHSRYAKLFYLSLDDDERRWRDRSIPRVALIEPKMSAWRRILASGNDQSLITTTGLDFSVFGELKGRFESMYSQYSLVPVDGKYVKRKDTSGRRGGEWRMRSVECGFLNWDNLAEMSVQDLCFMSDINLAYGKFGKPGFLVYTP